MAYRFDKSQDTVQDGVRDIAAQLIDKAIAATKRRQDAERRVHNLRKTCKKLRGLIRLVRPVFADYHAENAAFRAAGRGLSHLRDTAVLIQTYDSLLEAYEDQVERTQFAPIRRRLTLQHRQLTRQSDMARQLEEFRERMSAARSRVSRWRLSEDGFRCDRTGPREILQGSPACDGGGFEAHHRGSRSRLAQAREGPLVSRPPADAPLATTDEDLSDGRPGLERAARRAS